MQNLDNCNKDEALKEMGRALHTLQDFYAHSNWVNHWGGVNAGICNMANRPSSLSCSPPTFAPGGVTTGYFSLIGYLYPSPIITQCVSTPSNKCCHKELNKDEPSRPFHGPARASAEAATAEFAERVETEILTRYPGAKGEAMVKLLKKDQRDIAFVIDDTGSMSTDLAGVKATVNSLVDSISAGNESPRFSLYTFKDRRRRRRHRGGDAARGTDRRRRWPRLPHHLTASDGRGGSTQGAVTVCVPHDNSKNAVCVDSGVRFDSTVCTPE